MNFVEWLWIDFYGYEVRLELGGLMSWDRQVISKIFFSKSILLEEGVMQESQKDKIVSKP